MNTNVINREASDKTKGFRLQKMRAIKLMIETIEDQETAIFYTAIEDVEDVSHTTLSNKGAKKYYEEDKNYDEKHIFTIFSPEVKNTLVSFFDIYVNSWKYSEELLLGFYTTASIGKERKKFLVDGAEIDAPNDPVLKVISSESELSDDIVKMVKSVVLEEYERQYALKNSKGNLTTLEEISIDTFKNFLGKVVWHFGGEDEEKLKETVIQLIKKSIFHNVRLANKEEGIFSILMEMLDERQNAKSLARRVVFAPDVKLVFKQAESEESDSVMDPTWSELKKIEEEITDKRNLKEKITSVCPEYAEKKIKHLARLACRSKTEQMSSNKSFLSLKYRAYEACSEYFFSHESPVTTESDVDNIFEELKKISEEQIAELRKDYTYTISNSQAVSGIIMDLFDGCFVSFDEGTNEK